jgi:hypothetical protein
MNRAELLSLIGQLSTALSETQTPVQWTQEDSDRLRDIHAATVAQKRTAAVPTEAAPPAKEVPMFRSIPQSEEPSLDGQPKKKKNFWQKLGSGAKTALAGVAFGAGGGALGAVVDGVKDGNLNPASLAATAAISAITGAIGYYQKSPKDEAKED